MSTNWINNSSPAHHRAIALEVARKHEEKTNQENKK